MAAVDINGLSSLLFNPYAAGGLFEQKQNYLKKVDKMGTLAYGYSFESTKGELSNEYKHDKVQVYKNLCILVLLMKVALAL